MEVIGLKSRIVKEEVSLVDVFIKSLKRSRLQLKEKDILVIASKVLAISQGRIVEVKNSDYKKGDLKKIIKQEAGKLFGTNYCWLTCKNNQLIPNAGVDKSNMPKGNVVLWPENTFKEANKILVFLKKKYRIKKLGVIISDSTCAPLRQGVHGISIGYAGFEGIEDCRKKKDIYGNKIHVTRRAIADGLADAALIVMGETNERRPFALIRNAPVKFTNKRVRHKKIPLKSDLFYGIYNRAFKKFISKK